MKEFYVAAIKKLKADPVFVKGILTQLTNFDIISVSSDLIFSAIDCSFLNRLPFWDALIITSAASANCKEVWKEDLNHNQIIFGVRIKNPFLEEE